jgi:OOP family OmpA-OmpF porin
VGDESYNLQLSQKRAESVLDYLVSKGISRDRLTAVGYGETQPIADNSTKEGRFKNRRVELEWLDN